MVFDFLIKNGHVVDGSGNPWFKADLGVEKGKIAAMGRLESERADEIIDANGLVACPGFIDIHSHAELGVFDDPWANSLVRQGVTLFLGGQCGHSPAPTPGRVPQPDTRNFRTFREYSGAIESQGTSVNVSVLIGHGTLRNYVMGYDQREPTEAELKEMKTLTENAMEEGVFGLSTGLAYPPGFYAKTDELVEICTVVSRYGGLYNTHIRGNTKESFLSSVSEAIEIGERSGCRVQISHLETHYDGFGLEEEAIKLLDQARERGVAVSCDACTMVVGGGGMTNALPKWAFEGGKEKMQERLKDPKMRRQMREDIIKDKDYVVRCIAADDRWDMMIITGSEKYPEFVGKTIADLIKHKGGDKWDAVCNLILEGPPRTNHAHHNEEDIRIILRHPTCSVETDASIIRFPKQPEKAKPETIPRGIITYPMIFRKYVRGETRKDLLYDEGAKILSLEEAVRKMTSLPAQSMGLFDRGLIREDSWADLVVFDKDRIRDTATFEFPYQYPEGISYVFVNGSLVVDNGRHTGALPGRVIRPNQSSASHSPEK